MLMSRHVYCETQVCEADVMVIWVRFWVRRATKNSVASQSDYMYKEAAPCIELLT